MIYHVCEEQNKNLEVVFPARVCGTVAEAACSPPSYLSRETAAARRQQREQQLIQGRSKEMKFRQLHSLPASYTTTSATHILPAHTVVVVLAVAVAH